MATEFFRPGDRIGQPEFIRIYEYTTKTTYSHSRFAAKFGVGVAEASYVYNNYCMPDQVETSHASHLAPSNPVHLLWTLNFMKSYTPDDDLSASWHTTSPTYRKHVFNTVSFLSSNLNEARIQFHNFLYYCNIISPIAHFSTRACACELAFQFFLPLLISSFALSLSVRSLRFHHIQAQVLIEYNLDSLGKPDARLCSLARLFLRQCAHCHRLHRVSHFEALNGAFSNVGLLG